MKAKEFRGMTVSEINEKIAELKTELLISGFSTRQTN